jgi:hypothetical protein
MIDELLFKDRDKTCALMELWITNPGGNFLL